VTPAAPVALPFSELDVLAAGAEAPLLIDEDEPGDIEDGDEADPLVPPADVPDCVPGEPGVTGAGALEDWEVVSLVDDFLFLFMSPSASAEALPSRMTEEKNTGASLRMRPP
jgi:hypothetical protein